MALPVCLVHAEPTPPVGGGCAVWAPALARFPPSLRDLLALLPVADANGELFAALPRAAAPWPADVAAGLFLADPFLNLADAARRLRAAGVRAVANFPTLQGLGGEAGRGLEAVGYGFESERAGLAKLAALGFVGVGYAGSAPAARALVSAGVGRLVALPPLGASAAARDALLRGVVEAADGRPVHLHAHAAA